MARAEPVDQPLGSNRILLRAYTGSTPRTDRFIIERGQLEVYLVLISVLKYCFLPR